MKTCDLMQHILSIFKEAEHHGYDLHRLLKLQNINVGTSRLYSILDEMKEEGLLLDRWEKSNAGPKKRIYSLSKKGHQARLDTLHHAIEVIREFYLDYLQNLPESTNVVLRLYKNLASQVPADANIVCLFSSYGSFVDFILNRLKTELPLANTFLITPKNSRIQYPDGWQSLAGRCDDIPLKDNFVDLLFVAGYRNEFSEDSCIKEWQRVLGKDGRFSLVTPNNVIDELANPLSIGDFIESIEYQGNVGSSTWNLFRGKIDKILPSVQEIRDQEFFILQTS